ncbi:MAG: hypothetical protein JWP85_993 [Rhodoglobus sp.]|nr:hypothetical protein [Rhodoglobus sp.]
MAGNDRIIINFGADTREVEVGGRKIEDVLSDTEKALEDLGATGEDSLEKVTKGQDDVADNAKEMGDGVAANGGKFEELADKADGSLGEIGEGLLGIAGIAGGVGGVVTTVVGGAVDFVTQKIEDQTAAAEELKTRFIDAYQTAAEEGRNYLDTAQIVAAASDIFFDPAKMDEYRTKAAAVGVDVQTYVLAQAGSYEDLAVVIEAAKQKEQERVDAIDSARGGEAYVAEVDGIRDIIAENETLIQTHKDGASAAENAQAIKDQLSQNERNQIKRTSEADQARYEALATAYDTATTRPPIDVPVNLDVPDVDGVLDGLQRAVSRRPINVTVNGYTRNGERIV